jgi:hypothetical protein
LPSYIGYYASSCDHWVLLKMLQGEPKPKHEKMVPHGFCNYDCFFLISIVPDCTTFEKKACFLRKKRNSNTQTFQCCFSL